ncbi:MAG TPA: HPr(Ser) kinase/phosphatase [Gammaproteobacteria bacterium]
MTTDAMSVITAQTLFDAYHDRLGLRWLTAARGETLPILQTGHPVEGMSLIGHLNFVHPYRIQVIGEAELTYLQGLGSNSYHDLLSHLFGGESAMVLISSGLEPPSDLVEFAARTPIPLLSASLPSDKLIGYLGYYLNTLLADRITIHGVFLEVMGIGVLLTGESAVGKSELALELITRGHRLVADDAPEFTRIGPDVLRGHCPELLRDFLEVRGLGILNVRAMFGDNALKQSKDLRLIVHLNPVDNTGLASLDRLRGARHTQRMLDVEIPVVELPVAPGRNLAVLVEAAARNYILYHHGYDAPEEFIARQQRLIQGDSP